MLRECKNCGNPNLMKSKVIEGTGETIVYCNACKWSVLESKVTGNLDTEMYNLVSLLDELFEAYVIDSGSGLNVSADNINNVLKEMYRKLLWEVTNENT